MNSNVFNPRHNSRYEPMSAPAFSVPEPNSKIYRGEPLGTVNVALGIDMSADQKYSRRVQLSQSMFSFSEQHSSKLVPLKGRNARAKSLTTKLILFIVFYSLAMFLFLVMQLHLSPIIDANSRCYKQLKSLTIMGEDQRIHKLRLDVVPAGLTNHESLPQSLLDGDNGSMTIRRYIGGLHLFHHSNRNDQTFGKVKKESRGLGELDIGMYDMNNASRPNRGIPRVIHLHAGQGSSERQKKRRLDFDPTPFSDNTQLYGIRNSDDEAVSKMEILLTDDDDGECVSEPWQRAYHPSCNGMHEFDLLHVDYNVMWSFSGYWRNAWRVDLPSHNRAKETETLILKSPK